MIELADFFRDQLAIRSIDDFSRLPAANSPPIKIDYGKLSPQGQGGLDFSTLFNRDFTIKWPGAEEASPLANHILSAMDRAGYDLSALGYGLSFDTSYVVASAPRGDHIDGHFLELIKYRENTLRRSKTIRIVQSNICSTAILPFNNIGDKCPEGYDREYFYACALAYVDRPGYLESNLIKSGIQFSSERARKELIQHTRQTVEERQKAADGYVLYEPSCPVPFTFATIHAMTCREITAVSSSDGQERHRLILTISPLPS